MSNSAPKVIPIFQSPEDTRDVFLAKHGKAEAMRIVDVYAKSSSTAADPSSAFWRKVLSLLCEYSETNTLQSA